ncbi:hypothetical protein BGX30_006517 [Mortierella sp. GBA39]|nr:hypothetical protein BGX30_006517 [Mortierella sp. GBA39]
MATTNPTSSPTGNPNPGKPGSGGSGGYSSGRYGDDEDRAAIGGGVAAGMVVIAAIAFFSYGSVIKLANSLPSPTRRPRQLIKSKVVGIPFWHLLRTQLLDMRLIPNPQSTQRTTPPTTTTILKSTQGGTFNNNNNSGYSNNIYINDTTNSNNYTNAKKYNYSQTIQVFAMRKDRVNPTHFRQDQDLHSHGNPPQHTPHASHIRHIRHELEYQTEMGKQQLVYATQNLKSAPAIAAVHNPQNNTTQSESKLPSLVLPRGPQSADVQVAPTTAAPAAPATGSNGTGA